MILKRNLRKYDGSVIDWIGLVEDWDYWLSLVNTVMNLWAL